MSKRKAFEVVIAHLDKLMEQSPSKQLADVSNFLQEMVDKGEV